MDDLISAAARIEENLKNNKHPLIVMRRIEAQIVRLVALINNSNLRSQFGWPTSTTTIENAKAEETKITIEP
jgi:hypothetical protein